jgi:hypothetical protein
MPISIEESEIRRDRGLPVRAIETTWFCYVTGEAPDTEGVELENVGARPCRLIGHNLSFNPFGNLSERYRSCHRLLAEHDPEGFLALRHGNRFADGRVPLVRIHTNLDAFAQGFPEALDKSHIAIRVQTCLTFDRGGSFANRGYGFVNRSLHIHDAERMRNLYSIAVPASKQFPHRYP